MATTFLHLALIATVVFPLLAQDPYAFLKARDYSNAIPAFEAAILATPQNLNLRKDYAYTLLKIGESEFARDQFAEI